jgi:hypothetical protein
VAITRARRIPQLRSRDSSVVRAHGHAGERGIRSLDPEPGNSGGMTVAGEERMPRRNRGNQVNNQQRSTDSLAARLSQPVHELCAPLDVELAECLAKVVVDRVRADEQLSGDLSVGATFRREASYLRLLRSELVSRIRGPSPGTLTRRLQLAVCAPGERFHAEVVEHLVSDPQLPASVRVTTLTSEPLAVKKTRAC